MSFTMYVPTKTLFGAGMLNKLHEQRLPGRKALIVISNGKSTKANGYLARLENELKLAGVEWVIFDRVEPNPLRSTVMAGQSACEPAAADRGRHYDRRHRFRDGLGRRHHERGDARKERNPR